MRSLSSLRSFLKRFAQPLAVLLAACILLSSCKETRKTPGDPSSISMQLEKDLSFKAGGPIASQTAAVEGFPIFQDNGAWSEGNVVSVSIAVPPVSGDLELTAEVAAFPDPKSDPPQSMTVIANGVKVGQWKFASKETSTRSVVIPKACFADTSKLLLRFEISHPTSPKSLGLGDDGRLLGVFFSKITFSASKGSAVNVPSSGNAPITEPGSVAVALGHTISLGATSPVFASKEAANGFAAPQENGVWTDGNSAAIHLTIPIAQSDLKLTAVVEPFLVPNATPGQAVKIFANNELIGDWEFTTKESSTRECSIPQRLLADGSRLDLRFEIASPASPKSLGLADDGRNLGLFFSSITLDESK